MYKVKLTLSPYDLGVFRQIPNGSCTWGNYQFYVNQEMEEADFWVSTFRAFENKKEKCLVAPENTIFLTQEPDSVYQYSQGFLNQFGMVISCQKSLRHKNVVNDIPANLWWNGKIIRGKGDIEYSHTYDDFKSTTPKKTKLISVISSDKVFTKGHRERLDFVMKLKEHYKDQLDLFGHGNTPFDDKWDALADYKYHICIENCSQPYYWTEKLADVFLSNTYPLYYGCTNVGDYFPKESLSVIDIHDAEGAIRVIDDVINNNLAERNADSIQEAKMKILDEYNMFPFLVEYMNKLNPNAKKEIVTMQDDLSFFDIKKPMIVAGRKISQIKWKLFGR